MTGYKRYNVFEVKLDGRMRGAYIACVPVTTHIYTVAEVRNKQRPLSTMIVCQPACITKIDNPDSQLWNFLLH